MVSYQNNANAATATSSASHTGSANYLGSSDQKYFTIDKAILQITWSNPQAIDYGSALSSTQLNAEANVLGSFAYDPLAGMVLLSCTQTLKATFTPTDTANYNCANAQVTLVVNPYSFTGFVQPIDMGGVFNKVKLGSTVPVKFSLDGYKVLCRRPKSPHIGARPSGLLSGPYRHTYDTG
jgi:hypothetical protein